jgi:hypothetical protein
MEGTSNMFDGSSRSRRSGSQNSALASANLILQPPENVLVANCCRSFEKPKPNRILAARGSALSDSISDNLECTSLRVISRPSRCLSILAASADVSAKVERSASSSVNSFVIF